MPPAAAPADELTLIARQSMLAHGLEPDFPAGATAPLRALVAPAVAPEGALRALRALPWCSIDNDDSRDLDQLTVAEPLAGGVVKILVAIADGDASGAPRSAPHGHA